MWLSRLFFICVYVQTLGASNILHIFKVVQNVTNLLDKTVPLLQARQMETRFKSISFIINDLDRDLSDKVKRSKAQTSAIIKSMPNKNQLGQNIDAIYDSIDKIEKKYSVLKLGCCQRAQLQAIERDASSNDPNSVVSLLEKIYKLVIPQKTRVFEHSVFKHLLDAMENIEDGVLCNVNQSSQQILYNLYEIITIAELEGITVAHFSAMLFHGKGNFETKVRQNIRKYEEMSNNILAAVSQLIPQASRSLWRCDPRNHIKGTTYEEVTRFMQGYIYNQIGLNSNNACFGKCSGLSGLTEPNEYHDKFFTWQRRRNIHCTGQVLKCQDVDEDMSVCIANPGNSRRYEYIEVGGNIWGKQKSCGDKNRAKSWRQLFFLTCKYCFCYCEEPDSSDRYFNMKSALADIDNNNVVTGLRFIKHNRIFHLQIQEGRLLPGMKIDPSTVTWKPVEDYYMTDRKIFKGQEFHMLTWTERYVHLDDLETDDGYILTGVRLRKVGPNLNLEIYMTMFDFNTGRLKPASSKWKSNDSTEREEVKLIIPNIPTKTVRPSIPDSRPGQYVGFTHSDRRKDAAQTAVPFLDAQPIESSVPLTGAGLFHKGRPYYGGFITPKLITFDVSKYMEENSHRR